jgi:processive 1,2-diacylglycerol beta-glucosyltransferase
VLVLSAPFGTGHRRAAEALARAFEAEGARAEVRDHFEAFVPAAFVRGSLALFWAVLRRAPALWGAVYRLSARLPVRSRGMGGMDRLGAPGLLAHLRATSPALVVHVHPTPAGALAWLRGRGLAAVPHGIVLTDFAAHPQWIYPGLDRYFVPTEDVGRGLVARGVPAELVVASGIPIDPAFGVPADRPRLRARLGLPVEGPVVLVVGGQRGAGGGVTDACRALATVRAGFTALVAGGAEAGAVARLRRRLEADRRFRVTGRIGDMPAAMGAADLVVTKAGALTCAEALALERPLVLYRSLPGQERANQAAVEAAGAGLVAADGPDLARTVADLLARPERRAALAAGARRLRRPEAGRTVAKEMLALAGGGP